MRAWASEPAPPLMACASIVSVGPVVCVSLSRLFPEILSAFWWAVAVVSPGLGHHSKQAFSCLIAFAHPSPVVGTQVGR